MFIINSNNELYSAGGLIVLKMCHCFKKDVSLMDDEPEEPEKKAANNL
jgi:hypothetical protein